MQMDTLKMNKLPKLSVGCPILDYEVNLDTDGTYYGCCHTTDYKFETIKELTAWKQEQKNIMLLNEWPEACKVCKIREEKTKFSLRIDQIQHVHPKYNGSTTTPKLLQGQINLINLCNYACIICTPDSSSGIYDLAKKSTEIPSNWETPNYPKWFNAKGKLDEYLSGVNNLERLTLLGGEPFMIKEYIPFLKKLSRNTYILIVTNASMYNKEIVKELKRFKRVDFCYSIDAYGTINEATRLNSKWSNIERNVLTLQKDFPNSLHNVAPTWSNFTMPYWKSLYRWTVKNGLWSGPDGFFQNVIQWPEHLKINNLSEKVKKSIKRELLETDSSFPKYIQQYMSEPQTLDKHYKQEQYRRLANIAMSKGIDYQKLFPHIYQDIQ